MVSVLDIGVEKCMHSKIVRTPFYNHHICRTESTHCKGFIFLTNVLKWRGSRIFGICVPTNQGNINFNGNGERGGRGWMELTALVSVTPSVF